MLLDQLLLYHLLDHLQHHQLFLLRLHRLLEYHQLLQQNCCFQFHQLQILLKKYLNYLHYLRLRHFVFRLLQQNLLRLKRFHHHYLQEFQELQHCLNHQFQDFQ